MPIQEERLIDLFKNLCLINAPALEEAESVAWTKALLQKIGLEVEEDGAGEIIGGNANNLIATLPANTAGLPRIYFSAHFDTVEPTEGLVIDERDGVFYSASDTILGADDKAGMAPIIEAVQCLIESGEPHGDIVLLLSCAEEIGLKGAAALKIEDLNLDYGYVLDTGPPVGSIVNTTATHDKMEIEIIGRPAHAGKDPEKGINAIQVAAYAIANMKQGRVDDETTANIGIIQAGTATNIVCPSCKVWAEARSLNVETLDRQINHMIQCFEEAGSKFGAEVKIVHRRHYDAYHVPEDTEVVQVAKAAATSLGMPWGTRATLGGSDANVYNKKGVPSVVLATGMEKIHTHDEFVSRKDLIDQTELVLQIVREVVARGPKK